jgi:hypothetical protein
MFVGKTPDNPRFHFDTVAGRVVLVNLFGTFQESLNRNCAMLIQVYEALGLPSGFMQRREGRKVLVHGPSHKIRSGQRTANSRCSFS